MPSLCWRKVLRDASRHRARTALVVAAIALSMASAGAILDAWALVRAVTRDEYLASNPPAATLRGHAVDDSALAIVGAVAGVSDVRARREIRLKVRGDGGWLNALLFISDDYDARRIGRLVSLAGVWPPRAGQVAVERSSLEIGDQRPGGRLTIRLPSGREVDLDASGSVRDVGLAPGWMDHVVYLYATRATLRELGVNPSLDEIQFTVRDPRATEAEVRRIAFEARDALVRSGRAVTNVQVPKPREHVHAAQMDSLLYTQAAFGVMAVVVCGFLVLNLMSAILAGQVREIGIMKTLGASPARLVTMYLGFAGALGAAAMSFALPAGVWAGTRYAVFRAQMLNFDAAGFGVPWWAVAIQLVGGVLVAVLAAAIPVRRGCAISVADAIRSGGIADGQASFPPFVEWLVARLPRPGVLSVRNVLRKRMRVTLTITALALGGALFLAADNLRRAVLASVDRMFAAQPYDVTVHLAEPHSADSVEQVLAAVPGIAHAEAWSAARGAIVELDGTLSNDFVMLGPPPGSVMFNARPTNGRWPASPDENGVVVTTALRAANPRLSPGATVRLSIGERQEEWQIVGDLETGPIAMAYTTRTALARRVGGPVTTAFVKAADASNAAVVLDLIQQLRERMQTAGMRVSDTDVSSEARRAIEDHLLMVVQFLTLMGWVVVVIGGLGLMSTMSLAVVERTREIGVLRAIGARHASILGVIHAEGITLTIASCLLALLISLPISVLLERMFSRTMLDVPAIVVPSLTGVGEWTAIALVLSFAACALPARRAALVPVSRALAYE